MRSDSLVSAEQFKDHALVLECSVIVATYNRAHLLCRLLESLQQQDIGLDRFEIIVVDDGSTDDTQLTLQPFERNYGVKSFHQNNQGPGSARNKAIQEARADVIISLDDDVSASPDLLRRHLRIHKEHDHAAATGVMVLPRTGTMPPWIEWEARTLQQQYSAMVAGTYPPTPRQFYTGNASFRKSDALRVGLFNPYFRRAEDVELAYRLRDAGVEFFFDPEAIVYHEPDRTYSEWLRIPRLYGKYDVVMAENGGRNSILVSIANEFYSRPKLMRTLARLLIGKKGILALANRVLKLSLPFLISSAVRQAALSAVFNLEYWQGAADELGDAGAFWNTIATYHA